MDSNPAAPSSSASVIRPFRWSDLVYGSVALGGAWYGTGDWVFMVLAFVGSWLLLFPLLGWLSGSFSRASAMIFITLVLMFGFGRLWKEGIVRYGMTIPERAIPLIEKFHREHGYVPERMEDIPGTPWIPPLFHYEIWDEGTAFSIRSEFDYWENWTYIEEHKNWKHFSM